MIGRLLSWIQRSTRGMVSKRLAPFLLLGPVTGPFMAGVVFNFKDGRPVLGGLYMIALGAWYVALPVMAAHVL